MIFKRPNTRGLAVLPVALALVASAPARAESELEGTWDTPLGKVRVEPEEDGYVGRLVDAARQCGWPKGTEVLRGHFADELFSGEVRVCYPARCRPEGWLFAMAAPVDGGERLVGAAAPADGCVNAVYQNKPFQLARVRADGTAVAEAAAPAPGVAEVAHRRAMKPEVQKLYLDGMRLSSAGRYESARQKFIAAQRLDASNPEILTQIGVTWYARADFQNAATFYRRAIAADASFAKAHYNLACVLAKSGNSGGALRSLKAAVDVGFASVSALDADSDLDTVRTDPTYEEIRRTAERNAARAGR